MVFKVAALLELSLVILENSGYVHLRGLPLGGGEIQQVGIVFATAYVVAEFIEVFRGPPPRQPGSWAGDSRQKLGTGPTMAERSCKHRCRKN
jgi:hypothetical protein